MSARGAGARPLRAVLLDWGDTLFHAPHGPAVIVAAAREGGVAVSDDDARRMWAELWEAGKTPEELAKGRDLSPAAHREVWTALFTRADRVAPGVSRALYQRVMEPSSWVPYADTRATLEALRARGIGSYAGGHDEKEQTLNQLLVELDGFDSRSGLVILAATNRPEILDPALLRAGRFDRQVLVDRPDKKGRVQILEVHMKKVKIAADVDADKVAALTPGFTGADLANLVNEAALLATRRGADATTMPDFGNAAMERIVAGLEKKNRLMNPHEREVVAHHEMGHALVALSIPGSDKVHKVSIIPRGIGSLGYTIQRPTEDRFLMTREELENKMAVSLGGRAAELIVFGHLSTGAADDLRRVTDIARSMVTRYGMSDKLGNVAYDRDPHALLTGSELPSPPHERDYAEKTAATVDDEVRAIVEKAFQRALDLLKERRAVLDRTAQRLLEKETLEEAELTQLANHPEPRSPQAAAE